MKEDNFAARVAKKVNKAFAGMEKAEYDKEPYYAHPTFYINNLSEYIQLVTSIASIILCKKNCQSFCFFQKSYIFHGFFRLLC